MAKVKITDTILRDIINPKPQLECGWMRCSLL